MVQTDKSIAWRVVRRLRSSRGSAFVEFAFTMPLVIALMCFAVDFVRILYCEQQIEIATRALCDVESHITPGQKECPNAISKGVVRKYLAGDPKSENDLMKVGALTQEGLTHPDYVYCKGNVVQQSGLIHTVVNEIVSGVDKLKNNENTWWSFLGKFISFLVNLATMRTQTYITEIIPNDKIVRASVSVKTNTFVPAGFYDFFGTKIGGSTNNWVNIPAYVPGFTGKGEVTNERTRYYCHLPVMETAPIAPVTYTRQLAGIMRKWVNLLD